MAGSILVFDPNPGFAGMVQQTLQEAGYDCHLADTAQEALRVASSVPINLAILDLDLQEPSPEEFVRSLRALNPKLVLVGIPPDNNPHHPLVERLGLQAATTKPFYMPEFLPMIERLLQSRPQRALPVPPASPSLTEIRAVETARGAIPKAAEVLPSPLQDPHYAQDLLSSLCQTVTATACLLSRAGKIWAASGDLQPAEAEAAAAAIDESWSSRTSGVVVRYLNLPSKEEEYLLYSTPAPAGLHLTLVFDTWQPSARMRAQAKQILTAFEEPRTAAAQQGKEAEAVPAPAAAVPAHAEAVKEAGPPPAPQESSAAVTRRLRPEDIYTMATRHLRNWPMGPGELGATAGAALPSARGPATAEGSGSETSNIRLTYHLVLAPADETLRLVPEVASDLEGFTRNLVVSLGCRPTRVSAHPDYLLVSLSAPPTVLPSLIVGHLRSSTTEHLLERFPSLAPQSRTGDFWARSHLLTTQEQPPTPGQVANFLSESHPMRRAGRSGSAPNSPL